MGVDTIPDGVKTDTVEWEPTPKVVDLLKGTFTPKSVF
jgi:hypothetical protein